MSAFPRIRDFREGARRRLPRMLFDYLDGGSFDEITLGRNRADLDRLALEQRVLRDMGDLTTASTLLGTEVAFPAVLAPVGMGGMFARRGETMAYRAAAANGAPMCVSTMALCSIEEIASAAQGKLWFQLYITHERGHVGGLLDRARAAGAETLLITVDLPGPGARYRDQRGGISAPPSVRNAMGRLAQGIGRPGWVHDVYLRGRPHMFGNIVHAVPDARTIGDIWTWTRANFDTRVTWDDLVAIRKQWPGKVALKGIMSVEDARRAADEGYDGIVVSNHGARQLDSVPSTIAALPPIADAVGDRIEVLMDGGIMSGIDMFKAIASGAKGCLIGRAWAYALAAAGERGVDQVLRQMKAEFAFAMTMTGRTRVDQIGRADLARL